jgi:hypothetical protein
LYTSKKDGKRKNIQRYRCKNCNYVFENKKSKNELLQKLRKEYVDHKQTQKQLATKYSLTSKTIRKYLNQPTVVDNSNNRRPSSSVVLMDTTYFGRTFSVMVFRDAHIKKNLYWKFLPYETIAEYVLGIDKIEANGTEVKAIVCDGRRGVFKAFKDLPLQMCQFHQIQIVKRYLTRNPRLEASQELAEITGKLTRTDEASFKGMLEKWHEKWRYWLKERTINEDTGRWHYTHKRTRSAYYSLIRHIDHLFTYQRYPDLEIPNTTNGLEGIFTNIKTNVRVHRGLKLKNKQKLISEILQK